jgi:hypothetical protein
MDVRHMLEQAKMLKTLLPAEDFAIGGSLAFKLMGFSVNIKDIDIILIKPTQEAINIMKRYAEEYPPKIKSNYPDSTLFRFVYNNVEVDIFTHDQPLPSFIYTNNGIKVSSLERVVKAKRNIGRLKDYAQLYNLSSQIITEQDYLNITKNKV